MRAGSLKIQRELQHLSLAKRNLRLGLRFFKVL